MRLILASTSPRRRELLTALGLPFDIVASRYEEPDQPTEGQSPEDWVVELALGKAQEVASRTEPDSLIIGADTTVVLDEHVLGKPKDPEDAVRMLRHLSGRTHQVYTGIAIVPLQNGTPGPALTDFVRTGVTFDTIPESVLHAYVATGKSLDKAGAYGIQGRALSFIPRIDGDYFNVVGFPLQYIRNLLLPYFPDLIPAPPQPILPDQRYYGKLEEAFGHK